MRAAVGALLVLGLLCALPTVGVGPPLLGPRAGDRQGRAVDRLHRRLGPRAARDPVREGPADREAQAARPRHAGLEMQRSTPALRTRRHLRRRQRQPPLALPRRLAPRGLNHQATCRRGPPNDPVGPSSARQAISNHDLGSLRRRHRRRRAAVRAAQAGLEPAGTDGVDLDVRLDERLGERDRERVERRLGALIGRDDDRVVGRVRVPLVGQRPHGARDVDDPPRGRPAQQRQEVLRDGDRAEHVRCRTSCGTCRRRSGRSRRLP